MKRYLFSLALGITLPLAGVQAEVSHTNAALQARNALAASIANADLTLAVINAEEAIREVRAQEAINSLTDVIAKADLSIALAQASNALNSVGDAVMLAELQGMLENSMGDQDANRLIMAVVSERPALASEIQGMAMAAGYNEAMVANAVIGGLGAASATAAGQKAPARNELKTDRSIVNGQ